jgi:hypothetical protein
MTITSPDVHLPADLARVVDAYRTCELLTVTSSGIPIAWPTVSMYRPEDGTFLITTSIALPQKAFNIRKDPRVALLFSDPTASGLTDPPQVLVQGTAVCPDEVVTEVAPLADLWVRLRQRQPESKAYTANALTRRLFDWYFMRLVITVTPTAVRTRPALAAPEPLGTPGSPASGSPATGSDPYADVAGRLPGFHSAVLCGFDAAGAPTLVRVRPTAAPDDRSFTVRVPDGVSLRPGSASLLCHSHDEHLWNLRSFAAVGELSGAGGDRRFVVQRVIPGSAAQRPADIVRMMRQLRRVAKRYLQRRGLARPSIPWADYHRAVAEGGRTGAHRG